MRRLSLLFFITVCFFSSSAQELYPYTEPASNMPSHSVSGKLSAMYEREIHDRVVQRYTPEVMFGLSKNWMLHLAGSFSNMHQPAFQAESIRTYAKWRFYSDDDVHKHFRMAAFALGSYSKNHLDHNEINLMGDQSGVQGGLIATQLWNKLAVSATGSWNEVLDKERNNKMSQAQYAFQSINYSLSAGYLVLPLEYTSYNQTNMNVYVELLGSRLMNFSREKYFIDLAPSLQFIFNSTSKLNLGYRFQLSGDIYRLADKSFMLSYEYIFLNALKKKKQSKTS